MRQPEEQKENDDNDYNGEEEEARRRIRRARPVKSYAVYLAKHNIEIPIPKYLKQNEAQSVCVESRTKRVNIALNRRGKKQQRPESPT